MEKHWLDEVLPVNTPGLIILGLILTLIFAYLQKRESGSWTQFVIAWIGGFAATLVAVFILQKLGYL